MTWETVADPVWTIYGKGEVKSGQYDFWQGQDDIGERGDVHDDPSEGKVISIIPSHPTKLA